MLSAFFISLLAPCCCLAVAWPLPGRCLTAACLFDVVTRQWADGYAFRFGLHYVQYDNNTNRIPKASSKWYGQLAQTGVIPPVPM